MLTVRRLKAHAEKGHIYTGNASERKQCLADIRFTVISFKTCPVTVIFCILHHKTYLVSLHITSQSIKTLNSFDFFFFFFTTTTSKNIFIETVHFFPLAAILSLHTYNNHLPHNMHRSQRRLITQPSYRGYANFSM